MVLRVTGRPLHKKTLKNMSIYYSKWVYEEWSVYFLYSDAFDLQFGVVIFCLKAGFDNNGKRSVVTDEQTSDDSPPLGSIGGQRESIQPLIHSSSPSLADS